MCIRDHMLKVCDHDILCKALVGISPNFQFWCSLHSTKMNSLDFAVNRSKVKVRMKPNMTKKYCGNVEGHEFKRHDRRRPFRRMHTSRRFAVQDHLVCFSSISHYCWNSWNENFD